MMLPSIPAAIARIAQTFWIAFGVMVLCGGCNPNTNTVDTRYGLSSRAYTSINGTSLFVEKLRTAGHRVTVKRRITPAISKYDVVFWMPDAMDAPSSRVVTAIELWLADHHAPTMVYVGRNYDAELDYMEAIRDTTEGKVREEIYRRIAEKKAFEADEFWMSARDQCRWFDRVDDPLTRTNQITGDWIEPGQSLPELTYSSRFAVNTSYNLPQRYSGGNWVEENHVSVDGKPFATSLVCQSMYSRPRIILISNACFLVNFGLVDPLKERLADALVAEFRPSSDILVLESGPQDIQVSDTNYENNNSWAWIAEAPLRYIVPHFLIWGVLFCFTVFPIFGRPKKAEQVKTNSFRNHINAIAKQLARSKKIQQARQIIQQYLNLAGERGKGDQYDAKNKDSNEET